MNKRAKLKAEARKLPYKVGDKVSAYTPSIFGMIPFQGASMNVELEKLSEMQGKAI